MYKELLNSLNNNKLLNNIKISHVKESDDKLDFEVSLTTVGENISKIVRISKNKTSQLVFKNIQDFMDFFNGVIDEKEKLLKNLKLELKIDNVIITKFYEGSEEKSAYFVFEGYSKGEKVESYYEPYETLSELKSRLNNI